MSPTEFYVRPCFKGGSPNVYHTDAECFAMAEEYRAVDETHVERRGLRICRVCADAVDTDRSEQYRPLRTRIEQGEVDV